MNIPLVWNIPVPVLPCRYGVDIEKARIAGLLHDCAKYLSSEDKISKCESYGIPVSDYERKNPELLHAKLGACFANEIIWCD